MRKKITKIGTSKRYTMYFLLTILDKEKTMENKVRHFQYDYIEDDAMLEYRKRKTLTMEFNIDINITYKYFGER